MPPGQADPVSRITDGSIRREPRLGTVPGTEPVGGESEWRLGRGSRASDESAGTASPGLSSLTRSGRGPLREPRDSRRWTHTRKGVCFSVFSHTSLDWQEKMLLESPSQATTSGYEVISVRVHEGLERCKTTQRQNGESLGKCPPLMGLFWGFIPEAHRVRFWGGLGPPYRPLLNYDGRHFDRLESGPSWGGAQNSAIFGPPAHFGPWGGFRPFLGQSLRRSRSRRDGVHLNQGP